MRLSYLFACFLLILPATVLAEKRAAFVVGNSVYDHAAPLDNPARDAALVGDTLAGLGFVVERLENASRSELTGAFSDFLNRNADADVTLLYFAGHGLQFEGRNYLVGRDARLRSTFDIDAEAVQLDRLVSMMRTKSRAALVFVDACRDNPLADTFYRENFSETRALMTRGLAPVQASDGAMHVFAASPGQVAYDGTDGNSPFAAALARHLPAANAEILSLMKRVIRDVKAETGGRQVPMVTNDLTTEIFLGADLPGVASEAERIAAVAPDLTVETQREQPDQTARVPALEEAPADQWSTMVALRGESERRFEAAKRAGTVVAYADFYNDFPQGTKATAAREAIDLIDARRMSGGPDDTRSADQIGQVPTAVALRAERVWGLESADVLRVQRALNRRGFDAGPQDGVIGPQTRAAIAAFQASVGQAATGVVSPLTARKLGVRYAKVGAIPLWP